MEKSRIENLKQMLGYQAVYYQLGKVYELLGEETEARKVYEKGIYVAASKGDMHTKSELEQALNELL
jgi:hypothetical protein